VRKLSPETLRPVPAGTGDLSTADSFLRALVNEVYLLALRMLWHPEDAEKATEEILLEVSRRVPVCKDQATLRSWVLRIAVGSLLSAPKSPFEGQSWTFETLAEDLDRGADEPLPGALHGAEQAILLQELQIGCTQSMLLCLDRDHRAAYVLGDLFEMKNDAAAHVLGLDSVTFRRRLLRAREQLRVFMQGSCGLLNPACACRCSRRLGRALLTGRVDQADLLFAQPLVAIGAKAPAASESGAREPAHIFRDQQLRSAPDVLAARLSSLFDASAPAELSG
jgi:DNA-directed RNA polymerase specialized sigma24 family protein